MAIRIALGLVKARELCAHKKGHAAMAIMDRVYSHLRDDHEFIEIRLLRCQIAIQVLNGPLALLEAETALDQLEKGCDHFKKDDRTYLKKYTLALIQYCQTWRDQKTVLRRVDMTELDMAHVSSHLKSKFPLPGSGAFV